MEEKCHMIGCSKLAGFVWNLPPGAASGRPVQIEVCSDCADMIRRVCVIPVTILTLAEVEKSLERRAEPAVA